MASANEQNFTQNVFFGPNILKRHQDHTGFTTFYDNLDDNESEKLREPMWSCWRLKIRGLKDRPKRKNAWF